MSIKKFVLGIGIIVVYALVLWQGVEAFYPQPEYNDYCSFFNGPRSVTAEGGLNCSFPSELDQRQQACYDAKGEFRYEYDNNTGCIINGYCDECSIEYNEAHDLYSRNVFFISLIAAIVTLIVGFSILSVEPVGSALIGSGIWAVFYGTVWNWRNFGNIWRFIILLVVLVLLIWIALRLAKKK